MKKTTIFRFLKATQLLSASLLLLLCSCSEDQSFSKTEELSAQYTEKSAKNNKTSGPATLSTGLTITTGMTVSQINAVIASATAGQTISVQPGTYTINAKINMKAGVSLANISTSPIFTAVATGGNLYEMSYTSAINNCTFTGITFWNIRFKMTDASSVKFVSCVFDYGKRLAGTDKKHLSDAYLHFIRVTNPYVNNCTFSRRVGNSGRGIYNVNSTNSIFSNNFFGNGGTTGYFTTSINDNSVGTQITGNTVKRIESWVNDLETDHGMYIHSFNNLTITGNTISGWPANSSGGAIKVRNGEIALISNNTLTTSGIMMYVYDSPTHPFLNDIVVSNNNITIASPVNDIYHGIGYWRNTLNGSEYSIRIENNQLPNGTIKVDFSTLDFDAFNSNGGGVFNNDKNLMYLLAGVANSGNY
jgi:hypothetical protein